MGVGKRKPNRNRLVDAEEVPAVGDDAWVNVVDTSSDVLDRETLLKVYRLEGPKCKESHVHGPCDAPYCVAGQSLPAVSRLCDRLMGPSPISLDPLTDDTTGNSLVPVRRGLRNLGNTCYLNAVLQMVSHSPRLCQHILDAASGNPSGVVASSGLPWLFLQMRFARFPSVNPSDFVSFLHVDHSIQQDAQEFLALLLQWLEASLPTDLSLGESAATALTEEIEGLQLFVRTCQHCGAEAKKAEPFWFLSVGSKNHLTDALDAACATDAVEGFVCGKCSHVGTATTRCDIKRLPSALMIHISRFQYDAKSNARIKLCDNISFPTVLDMKRWAPSCHPDHTSYALHGVINHIGATPTSGHYTYHARFDDDTWGCFDDEMVSKLRKYSGVSTTSREAYVLVYQRMVPCATMRDEEAAPFTTQLSSFPPNLIDRLMSLHEQLEAAAAQWKERRSVVEASVRHWQSVAETLIRYGTLNVADASHGSLYVTSKEWLRAFYSMFTADASTPQQSVVPFPFLREEFECPHGKLRRDASFKVIPEAVFVELQDMYGDHSPGCSALLDVESALCSVCAIDFAKCLQERGASKKREDSMKALAQVTDVTVGVFVNVDVLDAWLTSQPAESTAVAEDSVLDLGCGLECEHGQLNPAVPRRCIPIDVFQFLIAEKGFVFSTKQFPAASEPCSECLRITVAETSTRHSNQQRKFAEIKKFPTLSQDLTEVNKAVWKRDIATYTKKHIAAWKADRAAQREKEALDASTSLKIINKSAKRKNDGGEAETSPPETVSEDTPPPRKFDYFGIPADWVHQWRKWSSSPDHELSPPSTWSTEHWRCPHGLCLVDEQDAHASTCVARYGVDASPLYWLVKDEEYRAVIAAYGAPHGFEQLVFSEINDQRKLTPEPCVSCVAARLEAEERRQWQFVDGCITVEGRVRRSKRSYQDVCESFDGTSYSQSLESLAQLVSERILLRHGLIVPCDLIRFSSNKPNAAVRQMLDMTATLGQSRLRNHATVYFVVEDLVEKVHADQLTSHEAAEDAVALRRAIAASEASSGSREAAFGATRLSGLTPVVLSSAPDQKSCPICTFLNAANMRCCEICESELQDRKPESS